MRSLTLLAALALAGAALAHALLTQATPAPDSTVKRLPATVQLAFSEPVEMALSSFKVYSLGPKDLASAKREAARVFRTLLGSTNDQAQRADAGVVGNPQTAERVELKLKESLKPGAYAVMWRVLSVDTHPSEGFYVFVYQP
ncbi:MULTISPECIES: copper resistance CopC family protein [unclassified Meiothermus]|uniref:copper resistance CopC family protein n=1 Tax=unclassified Meiothermus TaxID=370471 RepID=UPI000D7CFAE6|nr:MULTISPECIES: copper resistance CopC family protein [unclassified Meiothermus]PZA08662.1 copper resistance protein CopC [Meiothermus sp. Pnk-1]RYM40719.1 copper resistance protein CopC [Meiothermus sp. PNK-Is4]